MSGIHFDFSNLNEVIVCVLRNMFVQHPAESVTVDELKKKILEIYQNADENDLRLNILEQIADLTTTNYITFQPFNGQTGLIKLTRDGQKIAKELLISGKYAVIFNNSIDKNVKRQGIKDAIADSVFSVNLKGDRIEEFYNTHPGWNKLFEREKELTEIHRHISSGDTSVIILHGQNQIGKTVLIKKLKPDEGVIPTRIDLQKFYNYNVDDFLHKFLCIVIKELNKQIVEYDLSIPKIDYPSETLFDNDQGRSAFESGWANIKSRCNEYKIVVILDEFNTLFESWELSKDVLKYLIDFIQKEKPTFILVCTDFIFEVPDLQIKDFIHSSKTIPVKPFPPHNVVKLFSDFGSFIPMSEHVIKRLTYFCDGHPLIIDNILKAISQHANPDGISSEALDKIFRDVVEKDNNQLSSIFHSLSDIDKTTIWLIARTDFRNTKGFKTGDLAKVAVKESVQIRSVDIKNSLKRVTKMGWLRMEKDKYKFSFDVMAMWLSLRYITCKEAIA